MSAQRSRSPRPAQRLTQSPPVALKPAAASRRPRRPIQSEPRQKIVTSALEHELLLCEMHVCCGWECRVAYPALMSNTKLMLLQAQQQQQRRRRRQRRRQWKRQRRGAIPAGGSGKSHCRGSKLGSHTGKLHQLLQSMWMGRELMLGGCMQVLLQPSHRLACVMSSFCPATSQESSKVKRRLWRES